MSELVKRSSKGAVHWRILGAVQLLGARLQTAVRTRWLRFMLADEDGGKGLYLERAPDGTGGSIPIQDEIADHLDAGDNQEAEALVEGLRQELHADGFVLPEPCSPANFTSYLDSLVKYGHLVKPSKGKYRINPLTYLNPGSEAVLAGHEVRVVAKPYEDGLAPEFQRSDAITPVALGISDDKEEVEEQMLTLAGALVSAGVELAAMVHNPDDKTEVFGLVGSGVPDLEDRGTEELSELAARFREPLEEIWELIHEEKPRDAPPAIGGPVGIDPDDPRYQEMDLPVQGEYEAAMDRYFEIRGKVQEDANDAD